MHSVILDDNVFLSYYACLVCWRVEITYFKIPKNINPTNFFSSEISYIFRLLCQLYHILSSVCTDCYFLNSILANHLTCTGSLFCRCVSLAQFQSYCLFIFLIYPIISNLINSTFICNDNGLQPDVT